MVSFGTSYHDTCEKNIVACERDLAASCPDRDLFRAFTSGMIIRKLKQRDGIEIDTPLQALQNWRSRGIRMWLFSRCTLSMATNTKNCPRSAKYASAVFTPDVGCTATEQP